MRGQRCWMAGILLVVVLLAAGLPAGAQEGERVCISAFHDANANGMREPIEPLLADVVATLFNEQGVAIANYLTNGQAEPFCFFGLGPGTYSLSFAGGAVAPTGDDVFSITLTGESLVPVQVQFGAVPIDPAAADSETVQAIPTPARDNTLILRLGLAMAGALLVMAVMALLGVIIYRLRLRAR